MPLTKHVRLPVTDDEHAMLEKLAGDGGIAAYLRRLLNLPARKPGRPWPSSKPKKP